MAPIKVTKLTGWWFSKYKWRLDEEYSIQTAIIGFSCETEDGWVKLSADGLLTIREGYCWDGASGPTWDTLSCRRGSLVHDALYQLIREGLIRRAWKPTADAMLREICIEDGMWEWRADMWYWAVTEFGNNHL